MFDSLSSIQQFITSLRLFVTRSFFIDLALFCDCEVLVASVDKISSTFELHKSHHWSLYMATPQELIL